MCLAPKPLGHTASLFFRDPFKSWSLLPPLEETSHGEHFTLPTQGRSSPMGGFGPRLLPGAGLHPHWRTGYRPPRGHSYLAAWLGLGGRSSLQRDGPHRSSYCLHRAGGSHAHSGCTPGMVGMTYLRTENEVTLSPHQQRETEVRLLQRGWSSDKLAGAEMANFYPFVFPPFSIDVNL